MPQPSDSRVAHALDVFTPQTLAEAAVRTSDERDRYREALRVIAEGEYASEQHAADYARRALDRSAVLPTLTGLEKPMASGGTIRFDVEVKYYWQTCPVCGGRGFVAHGFYAVPMGFAFGSTSTAPEQCRRCDGTGTITTPALSRERER